MDVAMSEIVESYPYRPRLYREIEKYSRYMGKSIVYVMLNPSYAKPYEIDRKTDNDRTILNLIKLTQFNGFAAFSVVNLFSYISPRKSDLLKAENPIGPNNDAIIADVCGKALKIVVAWGRHENRLIRDRAKHVLSMLEGKELFCFGINADGSPRHPGRISPTTSYMPFNVTQK